MQFDGRLKALHCIRMLSQLAMGLAFVDPGPEAPIVQPERQIQVIQRLPRPLQLEEGLRTRGVQKTAVLQLSYRLPTETALGFSKDDMCSATPQYMYVNMIIKALLQRAVGVIIWQPGSAVLGLL